MLIQPFHSPEAFEELKPEWNSVLQRASTDTLFLTWEWQKAWWTHLGHGDLCLTAVRDDTSALRALFPCHVFRTEDGVRLLRFIGCVEVTDYLDLIIPRGEEEPYLRAFLQAALGQETPAWDRMELCNIPERSPTLRLLPALAAEAGLQASTRQEDVCPVISLPATWEEYLQSLDKKQRHEIRRKLRRAATEAAMDWYIVGPEHDLHAEIDRFLELHRRSGPDKSEFMTPAMEAFFHAMGEATFQAGWLRLSFITLDGRHDAAMWSFDYNDVVMLYNSGFDPEGHPHLSPGNVLISLCIRQAIESGHKEFDFLRGDEDYKFRFGARETYVHSILIERNA